MLNLNEKNLITSEEACRLLRISTKTLWSYRQRRILPFFQVSRKIYYKLEDIHEYLQRHYIKSAYQKQEERVL